MLWSRVDGVVLCSMGPFFPAIDVFVISFQTLSEVAASSPSLLLGQFLLFVPKGGFFLLGHRVVELGIIPSRSAPCSAWMHICVFVRRFRVTARIQIDAFDFFILFNFLDRRKVFRLFPRWHMSSFIGILSIRFPLRVGRPVDRSHEIESFSADLGCSTWKNGPDFRC
ncbi:hypothetical protein DY000_02059750 [Brassica cretica]|uniref:Uncharacterized protein n=1 Tax=Brassica cretica TaxID=69181 RepID=A0ABQ7ANG3_BRACR|nr:hypothetical protein DY000_02059750 [Brassica cretica]